MPLPQWVARFNRRFVNPGALRSGTWPVLVHTGRKSGTTYRTPLGAQPIDDGYLFFINYGERTDWVQNFVAAGTATLEINGEEVDLADPTVIPTEEAVPLLDSDVDLPPGWVGMRQCLTARVAGVGTERAGG